MNPMAAYTPGSWHIKGPSSGLQRDFDDGGDFAVLDAEGFIVAEAFRLVGLGNSRPAEANAHLIAAAPDLYKVAEVMCRTYHTPLASCPCRTALAKARGES